MASAINYVGQDFGPTMPTPYGWGRQEEVGVHFILGPGLPDEAVEVLWKTESWGYIFILRRFAVVGRC